MSVEIRELVIRAVVRRTDGDEPGHTADGCGEPVAASPAQQAQIIDAAVREVLRILRASKER